MSGEPLENGFVDETQSPEGGEQTENAEQQQRSFKRSPFVPIERFEEVNGQLAELRELLRQKTIVELQMAEQRARDEAERREREEAESDDPTMVKHVGPYLKRELDKRLGPLVGVLTNVQRNQVEQAKLDYVATRLPDLDDLKEDMAAMLRSMPPQEREAHFEDPARMVSLGTQVRIVRQHFGKSAGGNMTPNERRVMRSLGTTETSGADSRPQLGSDFANVDANKLSDAEWQKARKQLGWA
jgi:hypothetical protein